ncbi:uncharacterized protein CEXT_801631 [Caerostris extrusa]|uniref:Uncharacterized protein n=1 Tax=Caerostris extrusa TaxID=172846 RepID=A0AAV4XI21_CAEEX|nr:uncharacterized protein CEXT_801631 [Caerostris extrusa]
MGCWFQNHNGTFWVVYCSPNPSGHCHCHWFMGKGTSANDLYSEAPCELHPLSAYKDIQGNIWGVGNGNLWWFNATNLSWSLLPMPNHTSSSGPWKVACVDPRRYTKMLPGALMDFFFAADPLKETLYLLDASEARWTIRDDSQVIPYVNWSTPYGIINAWDGYNGEYIMVGKFGGNYRVMYTNASEIDWVTMSENNSSSLWPDFGETGEGHSLAWKMGSDHLWLWKEDKGRKELWSFGYKSNKWQRGNRAFESKLPPLDNVLTGWENGKRYCILKRSSDCTSQYAMSQIECWTEAEILPTKSESENLVQSPRLTTISTTIQPKQKIHSTLKPGKIIMNPTILLLLELSLLQQPQLKFQRPPRKASPNLQ